MARQIRGYLHHPARTAAAAGRRSPLPPSPPSETETLQYNRVDRVSTGSRLAAEARLGRLQKATPPWSDQCRTALAFRRDRRRSRRHQTSVPDRLTQQIYLAFLKIKNSSYSSNKPLLKSKAKLSFECVALCRMVDCRLVCRQPSILILA